MVIVDNNSNDKTQITITYVYRERPFSLPENRNFAVKKSKGKIIVMIDSDVEFIDKNFLI
ncbi:MAG: glycosyltransferase [Thermoplasmata archaeon]